VFKRILLTVLGKRPLSVHRTVVLLLAWLIAPLAAGSAFLVHQVWADEHEKVAQHVHGWSNGIVQSVELHLGHQLSTLEAIASLPEIDRGDLNGIYRFARDVVADHPGTLVALVRPDGQLLLNTSVPFGDPLPNLWQLEEQQRQSSWQGHPLPVSSQGLTREVFRTGRVGYSDLYFGVNVNRPRTAIAVPVRRNGTILYALMLSQLATDLEMAVNVAGLPRQARVALLDRKGSVIATNGLSPYGIAQTVRLPAPGANLWDLAEDDGIATVGAHSKTSAGHMVLVSLPRADAYRTAHNTAIGWGLVSVVALVLSMLGAASLNRRIAEPLRRLAEQALAGGTHVAMEPTNVHEIDLLAAALRAADRNNELRRQEHILLIEAEKNEQAIEASEAQMRRVFAGLHVSVAVLNPDGCLIELNHAPARRPDSIPSHVLGRLFWDYDWWSYDPVVQQTVRESVAEARKGREAIRYNVPVRMNDGRLVMVDFQLSPLTDEKGVITRMIACAVDVQDRVEAIKSLQLRAAEARETARKLDEQRWLLDAALEATPAGIIVSDASGRLLRMNKANQRLWGEGPSSACSVDEYAAWKGWWAQGQEHQGEAVQPREWPLSRALLSARPESSVIDIEPFGAPGVRKTVEISAAPVLDEKGVVVGGVAVQMDITDRVRAEAALREADRHKDEFLAMLGHELRNPLGPIRSAIHILRKHPTVEPAVIRAQNAIERQTKQMTRLVDDLLDLARIKHGSITMERGIVVLQDTVAAAVEAVAPVLEAKGVRLLQEVAQEPLFVQGDATRLSQAIVNLLTNACKFTNATGQVSLRLARQDEAAIVEVADDGIGLAPDTLERIFGLFVQVQPSGTAGNSGLGIGLALSRILLVMHGGKLEAASAGLGKGSTFTARLPLVDSPVAKPIPIASIGTREKRPSQRYRLLVVDDNSDACDLMKELLEMSGFDANTAYDGATALVAAQATSHDAVVLDIGLPDINGYELCRRIRRQVGAAPVMIALTGWGQAHDKKAAQEAGFDAHITKPADPDVLCSTLMKLLKGRDTATGDRDQAVNRLLETAARAAAGHGIDTSQDLW
jgi:signal transduction histidine kinase/DNA-binding NarL/FixJ family response regulator